MLKPRSQIGNSMFRKDFRTSVFTDKTKFNKQWIRLMPYYVAFLHFDEMNVF